MEFAGYGLDAPAANYSDLRGKDYRDAAVIFLGTNGPQAVNTDIGRRVLGTRGRWLTEQVRAAASIGPPSGRAEERPAASQDARGRAASEAGQAAPERPDFTSAWRLDRQIAPALTGSDALLQFLFSRAPVRYDELKRKAESREPLAGFRLDDVRITFNIDTDYAILRTQRTQNIVAIVEGSDPALKSTYVAFGAHYDHVGYPRAIRRRTAAAPARRDACRPAPSPIASGTALTTMVQGPWR